MKHILSETPRLCGKLFELLHLLSVSGYGEPELRTGL
jgi:hypothetical protein